LLTATLKRSKIYKKTIAVTTIHEIQIPMSDCVLEH
jgi:hypothetical protein